MNLVRHRLLSVSQQCDRKVKWSRLSGQLFRVDKWSFCRVRLPCGGAAGCHRPLELCECNLRRPERCGARHLVVPVGLADVLIALAFGTMVIRRPSAELKPPYMSVGQTNIEPEAGPLRFPT